MTQDARSLAFEILTTFDKNAEATLDAVMDRITGKAELDRREMGLANALVYGVLRHRGQLDYTIDHFAAKGIAKIDKKLLTILRIALFQLRFMDRIPESAAVNTAVELAKVHASEKSGGFVNALLRNCLREPDQPSLDDLSPEKKLAVTTSMPVWLVEKWIERMGHEETAALCRASNEIAPITVRTNSLKTTREELFERLAPQVETLSPTPVSPLGLSFTSPKAPIFEMDAFKEGLFQVQDEAAQLIALMVNPKPGSRVLDVCAGVGGKSGHLAQVMENQGELVSMDVEAYKLQSLAREMKRLGITNITTHACDLTRESPDLIGDGFDAVLVDAPCSGLGVIRRNPDTKWKYFKRNATRHAKKQKAILSAAARCVRPGGTLVYAVCSMEPEENGTVVEAFLEKHTDFRMMKPFDTVPQGAEAFITSEGYVATLPHKNGMDGFFAARMVRKEK
ncbi:16S rRNA (cytosine(967)-C(5))-methyltransferase RsmB [Desulfoluna spongiiphila]|uniref:16S rRNA (cytosine(967)-C(5))-methyltransferase RsmB n=1 Tax=Desulfoluna spongiiphila TaxID=419481 RepID=UPI0012522A50|nr:16S rRNA (cytosine(967)-C(5))-methyltransferase RsmB [Desulfoluna spongiiphila]VVS91893.1 rrna small subunit methyltransferase b [Desulfoluna spongiiphila]